MLSCGSFLPSATFNPQQASTTLNYVFPHDRSPGCLQFPTHKITMNVCTLIHSWTLSRNVLECTLSRILNFSEFCPTPFQEVCTSLASGSQLLPSHDHPPFPIYSFKKTCKNVERKIHFLVNPQFTKIPPKLVLPILLRFSFCLGGKSLKERINNIDSNKKNSSYHKILTYPIFSHLGNVYCFFNTYKF